MIVVVLTSVYVVVSDGISPLITALFSSDTTLLVPYSGGGSGYNGLPVVLNIKPGVYNLGGYSPGAYNLPA